MAEPVGQRGSLAGDLGALLESGEATDVSLEVSSTLLPAHRAILAARSPVFGAMLRTDMQERRKGVIAISDMEEDVVKQMLSFMYQDYVPRLTTYAAQLLAAADKYDIPLLKHRCEDTLAKDLSVENAAARALLAMVHSCAKLTEVTVNFITANNQVLATDAWEDVLVSHPRTAAQICRRMVGKPSQNSAEELSSRRDQSQEGHLADDMAVLLAVGEGADITLKVAKSGSTLQAHRAVLAARCPTLAAKLCGGRRSCIKVKGMHEQVLREVLLYLYTDQAPLSEDIVGDVFAAAHKYSLPVLATQCEQKLAERLCIDTAAGTAVLAITHCSPSLRSVSVDFIRRHTSKVMGSDGWRIALLKHAKTAVEISCLVSAAAAAVAPEIRTGSEGKDLAEQLCQAADKGDLQQVGALLATGVAVDEPGSDGYSALHNASNEGRVEIVRCLLHAGADTNSVGPDGFTSLRRAAYHGHAEVVQLLVSTSTDVNASNVDGWTALHFSAEQDRLDVAAVLLEAGAHKDVKTKDGRTPLDVAKSNKHQNLIDILK